MHFFGLITIENERTAFFSFVLKSIQAFNGETLTITTLYCIVVFQSWFGRSCLTLNILYTMYNQEKIEIVNPVMLPTATHNSNITLNLFSIFWEQGAFVSMSL